MSTPPSPLSQIASTRTIWQGGTWLASVWEVSPSRGRRPVQAAALFREAADLFARAGRPLDEARCRAAASQAV